MLTGASWISDNLSHFPSSCSSNRPNAAVSWDHQNCIPLDKIPSRGKPVLLLTPVVPPPINRDPNDDRDPFEILGQSLSGRNIPIRHVPYTKQGITGVHVAFIKRARAVIFVIAGVPDSEGPSQLGLAELVAKTCESQPLIVMACCDISNRNPSKSLQTMIQAAGYTHADLHLTASLLLDGDTALEGSQLTTLGCLDTERAWSVQPWDAERDLVETHVLWLECIPRRFYLSISTLGSILKRDGYALHYVVRESTRGILVGFCATYTTFADSSNTSLIGSIAAIIVREQYRGQGIGSILHDAAITKLQSIRGVQRMQLGTTFPRLLCGLPVDATPVVRWFERRGWPVNGSGLRNKSRIVADWILLFADLPTITLASAGLGFRRCNESDIQRVLDMVNSKAPARNLSFGCFDQYARALSTGKMDDIVVGFEGATIVATAIIYVPIRGGPAAADIPWPRVLGPDIGGVTCVCIIDDDPEMVSRRDTVMVRLLHACYKALSERGMRGMFLDRIYLGEHRLESLGFQKWAEYREVWR